MFSLWFVCLSVFASRVMEKLLYSVLGIDRYIYIFFFTFVCSSTCSYLFYLTCFYYLLNIVFYIEVQ